MAQSQNVTKFGAGGSGNNYIPNGYIKAQEELWIDNYTLSFTNTNTTIDIAVLQPNRKITDISIYLYTTVSQTNGTLSVGFASDASVDTLLAPTTISHNSTVSTIRLPVVGFVLASGPATPTSGTNVVMGVAVLSGIQKVITGTQNTVSIKLNNWTMTTGNLYTVVRYT